MAGGGIMTVILAVLAAILGGAIGGVIGFFAIIAIGTLTGADNQQGALAMGAATGGLPLGAVIGAALAAFLVVRYRLKNAPVVEAAAEGVATGSGAGVQALIALLVVAAGIGAFWTWYTWSGDPAQFRAANRPVLLIEVRVPANDPDIPYAINRGTDLRSGQVYHSADGSLVKRVEGDHAILSGSHIMAYRTDDRSVELWLGQKRLLIFTLDLPAKPETQAEFSDWRRVDHVRPNFYGEDVAAPEGGHNYFIRTRVTKGNP